MPFLPHGRDDVAQMLKKIGVTHFEDLLKNIPAELREQISLDLPLPLSELEIRQKVEEMLNDGKDSRSAVSFLGGGAYDHFIPAVVDFIVSRPEFATAYTPYQAEVSQGTLQAMYEFQSLICALTGMDVSNASMYDGATAMAETVIMAKNIKRKNGIIISSAVHPLYRKTLETYAKSLQIRIDDLPLCGLTCDHSILTSQIGEDTAAVIVQSPNFFGCIEDTAEIARICKEKGVLFIQGVDPVSLAVLKTPGEVGADIVFGEGQALGNHQQFGGPYLGLFAARQEYVRKMPGRIAGMTEDAAGDRGYVLTLQTREQHIRREKATSNICSNEALCALAATVYLALMGDSGLKQVAELCLQKAHYLHEKICSIKGFEAASPDPFFKEFVVKTPIPAALIIKKALEKGFYAGIDLGTFFPGRDHEMLVAVTEKRSKNQLDAFADLLSSL